MTRSIPANKKGAAKIANPFISFGAGSRDLNAKKWIFRKNQLFRPFPLIALAYNLFLVS